MAGSISGKKIVLGVCGGIAAYKAAFLLRLMVKGGADVQVVMTADAKAFITPLTLSTLSGKPVLIDYFDVDTGEWNNHVHLARWADLILIAPATAHTLAKFAHGICDNLLVAVYLSAKSPVLIAPAMDLDMWKHGSTRKNMETLKSFGNRIIPPGDGELASGLKGVGRLAEPEDILQFVSRFFQEVDGDSRAVASPKQLTPLTGKKVLVTAGPTHEAIDPVRFIGNHSSGKMGLAVVAELLRLGAEVLLVHGPVQVPIPESEHLYTYPVVSAAEMAETCQRLFREADAVVMAAAVADYTPKVIADRKIKKSDDEFSIELQKTTDILYLLGQAKLPGQILVGFALETDNESANAKTKLERKNLDYIVLNSMQDEGAGFGVDTNQVTIFSRDGRVLTIDLKSKLEVASDLVKHTLSALMTD